jgi:superfamily II DNA or RNA helicase
MIFIFGGLKIERKKQSVELCQAYFFKMFIYIASCPAYTLLSVIKMGCTGEPYGRRSTYLTSCPPGLTPSYDIEYDGLWETNAKTRDELFDYEDEVHNQFLKHRMIREKPGDSEWFNFHGISYDEVKKNIYAFMESRTWVKRQVPLSEISPSKRPSRYLRRQCHKNLQYIKVNESRLAELNLLQEPVISSITTFIANANDNAGYVIAPCGSGKTLMTCKSIRGVKKCIICCPKNRIQNQWLSEICLEKLFAANEIHLIGTEGTTDPENIQEILRNDRFCIISTYASSYLLVELISNVIDLLILDEAHHMAGVVAKDETGEGRTRRLILRASELGIKRLSLTYTPRLIIDNGALDSKYISMDDDRIFGKKIHELKIRTLIDKGVLPDYRLWTLRDEARKGAGIIGKAECLLEAWRATEIIRGEEKYILHHFIIFASTTQEAMQLEKFFKEKTSSTPIFRLEGGNDAKKLNDAIKNFTEASRAILINCFVLDEGIDIPIANAVAITYPKQSRGQITQMILRAGRWYEGKPVFHVLIPTLGDEDLSGFEEVLSALASCDEKIWDEIVLRSNSDAIPSDSLNVFTDEGNAVPERIMIEEFDANKAEIKKCFTNIRKKVFSNNNNCLIQKCCIEQGIDTSIEYKHLRSTISELPEDPLPKGITWYDYLHPMSFYQDRLSQSEFVTKILDPNNLRVSHLYDDWLQRQPKEIAVKLPSVQHITDGFFGKDDTNFSIILERFTNKIVRRGR